MSLSYALGDDADLRRRLLVKIGAPLTVTGITASASAASANPISKYLPVSVTPAAYPK